VKKNILVNATSATSGGSLTILNQFIDNIIDVDKNYYLFVPAILNLKSFDNVIIVPIDAKEYIDRMKWDLYGLKKWCKQYEVKPNLIISLQNTAVLFGGIPQLIYLHQPLPYSKEASWNILKKEERKLWFYKYIYKIWIDISINKNHYIVVQTEWMRKAVAKSGYDEDKIIVSKPKINDININEVKSLDKGNKKYLFYPAADYKYKNHNIIIESVKVLSEKHPQFIKDIKIIFTLDEDTSIYKKIVHYGLEDTIKLIGKLKYEEVLSYYKSSDIVLFPSYVETFGLPLIEASYFKKNIVVSDCSYSREVLTGYNRAEFVQFNDAIAWGNAMVKNLNRHFDDNEVSIPENGWENIFDLIDVLA